MTDIEGLRKHKQSLECSRDQAQLKASSVEQRRQALKASFEFNWETRRVKWRESRSGKSFWESFATQYNAMNAEHAALVEEVDRLEEEIARVQDQIAAK